MTRYFAILVWLCCCLPAAADNLGAWSIDAVLPFTVNTHTFSTGAATDADSAPTYRIYEDETTTPIVTGTMALSDSANTAGFYSELVTLSAANGFENGKGYTIYISATVASVTATTHHEFQVVPSLNITNGIVDADVQKWLDTTVATPTVAGVPEVDLTHIAGSTTPATNLGEGFDGDATGAPLEISELSVTEGATIATSDANETALTVTGNGTGNGASITSGSGATGDAVRFVAVSTNGTGLDIVGTEVGLECQGGTGTGEHGAWFHSNSSVSGAGLFAAGAGSGPGIHGFGGVTGNGIEGEGGDTSGSGIGAYAGVLGHGIEATAVGSSKHGIVATGGTAGTSDGLKAVAGVGGVPIRGDITGNITGTITTATNLTNLPTIPANWLTAAGTAADFGTEIGTATWATTTRQLSGTVNDFDELLAGAVDGVEMVKTGLRDYNLDHLLAAAATGTEVVDNSAIAKLAASGATADWDTYVNTTMSLQANRANIGTAGAGLTSAPGSTSPQLMQTTTIATYTSNLSFTLTAGSADNDAYNGAIAIITDASTSTQKAYGIVSDYVGATKTITMASNPGVFTYAVGDAVSLVAASAAALTDTEQEPVAPTRTFQVVRKSTGLLGDRTIALFAGPPNLFAVDFRNDAPANDRIITATNWTIVTGTAGGITFGEAKRDKLYSKCLVTGVTAGTYVVDVDVTYRGGGQDTARVTFAIVQ